MNSQTLDNNPSYATVTQTTTFPKKDQAIVIDALENVQIKDYAQALGRIIEPSHIRFLSRISNNRICIYVSSKLIVDEIIDNKKYVTIQNQKLPIRPLISRNKRIIISNVCPIIPHTEIEKKLTEMHITPLSPISFLRAGLNETGYNHILSFRRQVYVTPEDFTRLPDKISIDFEETNYWIYFSSDTMTCFICKKDGHVASKCPDNTNDMHVLNQKTQESTETQIFKRPHPPTESSTTTDFMESETTKEDCIPSNENSDVDFDNSSLSSSDEVYKSKSGKKLKRTPHSDLDSTNWDHLENFIADSCKTYPLTGKQVKEYLTRTYGVKDISEITYSYTEEIDALIVMFTDLIPNISCRSVKSRLSRIVSKLKRLSGKENPKTNK
jgi:hypothetical protein